MVGPFKEYWELSVVHRHSWGFKDKDVHQLTRLRIPDSQFSSRDPNLSWNKEGTEEIVDASWVTPG